MRRHSILSAALIGALSICATTGVAFTPAPPLEDENPIREREFFDWSVRDYEGTECLIVGPNDGSGILAFETNRVARLERIEFFSRRSFESDKTEHYSFIPFVVFANEEERQRHLAPRPKYNIRLEVHPSGYRVDLAAKRMPSLWNFFERAYVATPEKEILPALLDAISEGDRLTVIVEREGEFNKDDPSQPAQIRRVINTVGFQSAFNTAKRWCPRYLNFDGN